MKATPEWVKGIIAHPTYTRSDYARFQAQLRKARKYGLLEMMQRLLKQKHSKTTTT
jgi:hypothetical protein